jgi:hypothetical protein
LRLMCYKLVTGFVFIKTMEYFDSETTFMDTIKIKNQ